MTRDDVIQNTSVTPNTKMDLHFNHEISNVVRTVGEICHPDLFGCDVTNQTFGFLKIKNNVFDTPHIGTENLECDPDIGSQRQTASWLVNIVLPRLKEQLVKTRDANLKTHLSHKSRINYMWVRERLYYQKGTVNRHLPLKKEYP